MEIRNEVKIPKRKDKPKDGDQEGEKEYKFVTRSLADIQRAKLAKLMKNPVSHRYLPRESD